MDDRRILRVLKQQMKADALLGVDAVPVGDANWPADSVFAPGTPTSPPPSPSPPPPPPSPSQPSPPPQTASSFASGAPTSAANFMPNTAAPLAPALLDIELTGSKQEKLQQLREHLLANQEVVGRCPPRTQVVFGEGDPEAELMFVGEGPGQAEAEQGRPFVGPAGQLLEKMIVAMGLSRESVYITNMVNFRPPNNRVPMPDEVALCDPYLIGQIDTVKPKVIVCLGGTASKHMLNTATGITRLRGTWTTYNRTDPPTDLMPTFHPAFLLRSYTTDNRKKVWSDLQQVIDKLGLKKNDAT